MFTTDKAAVNPRDGKMRRCHIYEKYLPEADLANRLEIRPARFSRPAALSRRIRRDDYYGAKYGKSGSLPFHGWINGYADNSCPIGHGLSLFDRGMKQRKDGRQATS